MLQPSGARLGCEEGGWGTWQCVPPVHNPSRWGRSPPHSEVGTVGGRLLSLLHKSHFTREGPARPHTRDAGLPRQLERRAGGSSRPTAARPRLGPRALQALLFKLFRVADARGAAGGSGGDRATQRRRAAAGILRGFHPALGRTPFPQTAGPQAPDATLSLVSRSRWPQTQDAKRPLTPSRI